MPKNPIVFNKLFECLENIKLSEIKELLINNSDLPSPRSNLELLYEFSSYFRNKKISSELLSFLFELCIIDDNLYIEDSRIEYLPCCGLVALGEQYIQVDEDYKSKIVEVIRNAMNDKRWRIREGSAMALQQLGENNTNCLKQIIQNMYENSNLLEKRAFIAALAHPPILKDKDITIFSLNLCDDILNKILVLNNDYLKTEEYKTLSKGLEYAISVFVAYLPKEGFELLSKFARIKNKQIEKILKSNLSKSRLTKKYSKEVEEIIIILNNY